MADCCFLVKRRSVDAAMTFTGRAAPRSAAPSKQRSRRSSSLLLVHLASLGRTERRRRLREDPEVSVGAGDGVVGFRNACANGTLEVVGDQSAPIVQGR
jgi:hypothetical protein